MPRLRAFLAGWREYRSAFGRTWDDDPYHPLSVAYDRGRDLHHRATLRRHES